MATSAPVSVETCVIKTVIRGYHIYKEIVKFSFVQERLQMFTIAMLLQLFKDVSLLGMYLEHCQLSAPNSLEEVEK